MHNIIFFPGKPEKKSRFHQFIHVGRVTLNTGIFFFILPHAKIHICHVEITRKWRDLPTVNDGMISPFHESFIFTKLRINENITLAKISQ